jgi:hypothetical protein
MPPLVVVELAPLSLALCARGGKSSLVFPSNPAHRPPTCVWLAMEMGEAEAKITGPSSGARNLQKRTEETPRRLTWLADTEVARELSRRKGEFLKVEWRRDCRR